MCRVVLDTNVLVSAIIWGGKPRELLLKLLKQHVVISSPRMLAELTDVLARYEIIVESAQARQFIRDLTEQAKIVKDTARFKLVIEDPDDNFILDAAYSGKADYIVTGDKHLLAIGEIQKTKILTVAELLEIIS